MSEETILTEAAVQEDDPAQSAKKRNTKPKSAPKSKPVAKDIDPHQLVSVKNGYHGRLVYRSKRTGEFYIWEKFGDEQDVELTELRSAKSTSKRFFEENWFMFNDEWIIDYLGVKQYYKHAVKVEDFDSLFNKDIKELRTIIASMSNGQKNTLAYRAKYLISNGDIDSNRLITELEKLLDTELIVR